MNWELIINTLGGAAILVGALAWLIRSLLAQYLNKDLERFKSELQAKGHQEVESFKATLKLEMDKAFFQFNTLHLRRADAVAKLYEMLDDLLGDAQLLLLDFERRKNRGDAGRESNSTNIGPWVLIPGITDDELRKIGAVREAAIKVYAFYRSNKIFFPTEVCQEIDRFLSLTNYTAVTYEDATLKDSNGKLMVNPKVQEVWIEAHQQIPGILKNLENRFRVLLGG